MSNKGKRVGSGVITQYLRQWRAGDPEALAKLTEAVYSELRRLAYAMISRQQSPQTIQPTELLHELYLELNDAGEIDADSRGQFLSLAAKTMRNILVDHARKRGAAKRGGGQLTIVLDPDLNAAAPTPGVDVLLVHDALERFSHLYPRQAQMVELRFFGGLSAEEMLPALQTAGFECSVRTVERDWRFARAWLQNELDAR